jgi:hypothetical protein
MVNRVLSRGRHVPDEATGVSDIACVQSWYRVIEVCSNNESSRRIRLPPANTCSRASNSILGGQAIWD